VPRGRTRQVPHQAAQRRQQQQQQARDSAAAAWGALRGTWQTCWEVVVVVVPNRGLQLLMVLVTSWEGWRCCTWIWTWAATGESGGWGDGAACKCCCW
jgi:hypothetical protein